jgi:hypothetical protein
MSGGMYCEGMADVRRNVLSGRQRLGGMYFQGEQMSGGMYCEREQTPCRRDVL